MNKIWFRGFLREIDWCGLWIDGVVNSLFGGVVLIVDGIFMMYMSNYKLFVFKSKFMFLSLYYFFDIVIFFLCGVIV